MCIRDSNRTYHHSSCPYCAHLRATPENCLAAVYPEVAAEWDEAKNAPLKPTDVLPGTDKSVWWKCKKGHSWRALIYTRTGPKPTKCPYCQGHAVEPKTSLAGKTPALAQYWHPVSYTHLDVYKRQVSALENTNRGMRALISRPEKTVRQLSLLPPLEMKEEKMNGTVLSSWTTMAKSMGIVIQ